MRRGATLILLVVAAACTNASHRATGSTAPATTMSLEANATLVYISDGDTIGVDVDGTEERVRLIGIDTPETKKPDAPVECFGKEASAHLATLLPPGTDVDLEPDVEARDRYGRLLAYVHRDDGLFVNLAMVADGYADALTIAPNVAHEPQLRAAVRAARDRDLGLWGSCPGPHSASA